MQKIPRLSIVSFIILLRSRTSYADQVCSSSVCLPEDYNKMDMPKPTHSGKPIKVRCVIRLLDINKIDTQDFSISVTTALKFAWIDNRIKHPDQRKTNVDLDFMNNIWTPDFYFYDLQSFRTLEIFRLQGGLRIRKTENDDTEVLYLAEAEITFTCPINYSTFPFHEAKCKLRMTSFNEKNDSMIFTTDLEQWKPDQLLDQRKIRGYMVNVTYLTGDDTMSFSYSGEHEKASYSVAGINIKLISRYKKYIFIYFIPTTMFTITSWVSYLLPPTSYPARTSLLVTVFLCQVGIFTAAIKDTPNYDEGMTSLELWCFACITCTFGALLGYVIILIRMEYIRQKLKLAAVKPEHFKPELKRDINIEAFLFVCTAGGFALFNVYYWLTLG